MSAAKSTSIYNRPIIDDEYCEKLDKGWKCKWCNKQYGQINQTRILIHFSRMAMHGVKGIEFCSGEINQEKLNYYQSKMRQHNSRKEIKKIKQDNKMQLMKLQSQLLQLIYIIKKI